MSNIHSIHDLEVYRLAFEAAMDVFHTTRTFPPAERYGLTDQLRRSSRSVAANLREGFAKRRYSGLFARHITDALGSAEETRTHLDFAVACGYLPEKVHAEISNKYDRIAAMLFRLLQRWT
ncbi:MAG: hypothetical protein B1H04_06200 [Planctomycetales bacterium 4484_123]|nr:MAG: hypothetical protein B1H04_06200 [Planctomycetales bacterium 4484_123]